MSNNFLNSERWLETDKFVNYLDNLFNCRSLPRDWKGYLNFFEEVGLFFPVLKIELPEILIRRQSIKKYPYLKDPLLSYDGFEEEEKVWIKLKGAQSNWKNFSTQVKYHPFDEISKTGLEEFFQTKFNENNVIKNKRVIVGQQCGKPIEDKGIYAYYHYWQLLQFAEIFLRTGIIVHYNSPQERVFSLEELLKERKYISSQRLLGIHALSEFEKLVPIFNAVAFFNAYSKRALNLITRRSVRSRPNLVEGEDFRQLKREEQSIAQEALQRYKVTEEEGHKLIEWLCEQWSCWSKECQLAPIMVEEYKQHILMAIKFYKTLSGKNFSDLINSIKSPIIYRKPILRVIFPNKQEDSQEIIQYSLIDWVKPSIDKMNEIEISEPDYVEFLDYIEKKGLFQFHWHFIQLGDIWKESYQVFEFSALYREVIGLGSTLEHIANELIEVEEKGLWGLNGKLQKIWEKNLKVSNTLKKDSTIFPKKDHKLKTCQKLLEDIERTEVEEFEKISKLLHKAIVIRNCGSHGSLKNSETEDMFSQQEQLKEYVLILLQAMIISWKQVFSSSASPSI